MSSCYEDNRTGGIRGLRTKENTISKGYQVSYRGKENVLKFTVVMVHMSMIILKNPELYTLNG